MWQTVLAHMLFRGDRFKIQDSESVYTLSSDPIFITTATGRKLQLIARRVNGSHRSFIFTPEAMVAVWDEAK